MDEREQRVVIEFLWLQEYETKETHAHLRGTLGATTVSLPAGTRWARRFGEGETSCEDKSRLCRPLTILGDVFSKFFLKYPFASAKMIVTHFNISGSTVEDLHVRELELRTFT
jgi:hypothetical protein